MLDFTDNAVSFLFTLYNSTDMTSTMKDITGSVIDEGFTVC